MESAERSGRVRSNETQCAQWMGWTLWWLKVTECESLSALLIRVVITLLNPNRNPVNARHILIAFPTCRRNIKSFTCVQYASSGCFSGGGLASFLLSIQSNISVWRAGKFYTPHDEFHAYVRLSPLRVFMMMDGMGRARRNTKIRFTD